MMADYNGWSNRETWNANLWLFESDERVYRGAQEIVNRNEPVTMRASSLKAYALEWWDKVTPDGCDLRKVNWKEIVEGNAE